jgi:glutamate--cysteine ligase
MMSTSWADRVLSLANDFEKRFVSLTPEIERWFRQQWQEHAVPFYGSVDLRHAGYKLSTVDTNLFPGGFNNLAPSMLPAAVQAVMSRADILCPQARNLLLIPENHTRNQFYLVNVARLAAILRQAGFTVRLGSLNPEIKTPTELLLDSGDHLLLEPLVEREINGQRRVGVADFDPCLILLNNDLSAGTPDILKGVGNNGQMLFPPLHAGWTIRRKTTHFKAFDEVAQSFADTFGLDSWCLSPYFAHCGQVDFQSHTGEDCLSSQVETVLMQIKRKYAEYKIEDEPFVIVKADAGTYGMGIMSVKDPSEVRDLNRKTRNKMAVIKDGLAVSDVIIQEGIRTLERVGSSVAEPVVYMMDRYVVGGFYRSHSDKGEDQNLNAPGMRFDPLPFDYSCHDPLCSQVSPLGARFYAYGVVARLALLAASVELDKTKPA